MENDPVKLENMDELRELISFIPGRTAMFTQYFDHMAVRWDTIDPRTATPKQKATWALLAFVDLETTDRNASHARTPEETMVEYQERFRGFTVNDFETMPRPLRSALRLALMQRDIYMGRSNANYSEAFANLVLLRELPEWNSGELEASKRRWPGALAWRVSVLSTERGPVYTDAQATTYSRAPTQQPWAIFNPQTPIHQTTRTGQTPMPITTNAGQPNQSSQGMPSYQYQTTQP
ncbi:hypothetical protein K445DRAFT_316124 [Daldinia sp. EC12]|nr:hypothetical protein F4774DRAFT_401616 [Daldinia eschscholtzii]OTB17506.1 hypothetical protein K445DRAFT_316124 [Daldinia sp. EC12]